MSEAADPDISHYPTFNEFFTRELKARRAAAGSGRSAVPGGWRDQPVRRHRRRRHLPGQGTPLHDAMPCSAATRKLAARFANGHFATLYLSPKDYHRIHMPCAARLTRMVHVPGDLFSVNPATARGGAGPVCAQRTRGVLLRCGLRSVRAGAGGCHDRRQHGDRVARGGQPAAARPGCANGATTIARCASKRGDEMGRFLLGSTVVLLFPSAAALQLGMGAWRIDSAGRGDGVVRTLKRSTHVT